MLIAVFVIVFVVLLSFQSTFSFSLETTVTNVLIFIRFHKSRVLIIVSRQGIRKLCFFLTQQIRLFSTIMRTQVSPSDVHLDFEPFWIFIRSDGLCVIWISYLDIFFEIFFSDQPIVHAMYLLSNYFYIITIITFYILQNCCYMCYSLSKRR